LKQAFTNAKSGKWPTSLAFEALKKGDRLFKSSLLHGDKTYVVQEASQPSYGVNVVRAYLKGTDVLRFFFWTKEGDAKAKDARKDWKDIRKYMYVVQDSEADR